MTDTPETAEWEPDEPDTPAEADTTPTDEQPFRFSVGPVPAEVLLAAVVWSARPLPLALLLPQQSAPQAPAGLN